MTALIYIYLAGVAESVKHFFGAVSMISLLAIIPHALWAAIYHEDTSRISKKFVGWMAALGFVFSGLSTLIPTKDTMYMMAYGYLGEKAGRAVLENEDVREVTSDLLKLVKAKVKEQIAETEKTK